MPKKVIYLLTLSPFYVAGSFSLITEPSMLLPRDPETKEPIIPSSFLFHQVILYKSLLKKEKVHFSSARILLFPLKQKEDLFWCTTKDRLRAGRLKKYLGDYLNSKIYLSLPKKTVKLRKRKLKLNEESLFLELVNNFLEKKFYEPLNWTQPIEKYEVFPEETVFFCYVESKKEKMLSQAVEGLKLAASFMGVSSPEDQGVIILEPSEISIKES